MTVRYMTLVACFFVLGFVACKKDQDKANDKTTKQGSTTPSKAETKTVVATTTMLADMARVVGKDVVEVKSIMKPGGDPHLHQPTPGDAKMVARSHLVLTSGLYLEGWIEDLVKNAGGKRKVIVASKGVKPITMEGSPGGVDPHFWFDIKAWSTAVDNVSAGMIELVGADSKGAQKIKSNTKAYKTRLHKLDAWVTHQLNTVPKEKRVVITSHDAFNYFGRAYAVEVVGIQGSSTEQEASQRDVANTIELVKKKGVSAIFVETSVNPALIKQVAKETGAKALGPLYSDSLGAKGTPAESYVGMITEDVRIIVTGLEGKYSSFNEDQPQSGK